MIMATLASHSQLTVMIIEMHAEVGNSPELHVMAWEFMNKKAFTHTS